MQDSYAFQLGTPYATHAFGHAFPPQQDAVKLNQAISDISAYIQGIWDFHANHS